MRRLLYRARWRSGSSAGGAKARGRDLGGREVYRMLTLYTGLQTWWADLKYSVTEEHGATAVEYALMVALIAVVIIVAVTFIGTSASTKFSDVGSAVNSAGS
jgi:pilus assembly protein Flp/PilA